MSRFSIIGLNLVAIAADAGLSYVDMYRRKINKCNFQWSNHTDKDNSAWDNVADEMKSVFTGKGEKKKVFVLH